MWCFRRTPEERGDARQRGIKYAKRSFDVKAAKRVLDPRPPRHRRPCPSLHRSLLGFDFFIENKKIAGFDFTPRVFAYEDRTFRAFCLRLTGSILALRASFVRGFICKADDPAQESKITLR